ncbi:hypothetical protein GCM10023210_30950 [Chryseobacterium ginsengisoli]|uniref:Bacteriophage CI repressor N-terminal domain-containing protein n=1 Tax=Chryseobacterium ginsengisoli TaxID=363853 RepID=A0ABP9MMY1_9FLAO
MSNKIDKELILNKIKLHYGFEKDTQFAQFLEVPPTTLSGWYRRNTFDIDVLYSKCVGISGDFLITGNEPMFQSGSYAMETSVSHDADIDFVHKVPQVVTVDSHQKENIPLVSVQARAGYLDGYYKSDFIKKLPVYRMPGLNNGTFRAFQVKGQSMNLSLHNQSYAVGEWVENWITGIKDDRLYIIVHEDWDNDKEGVLIKRCINRIEKYDNLLCKSDNLDRRSYPNINIHPSTIKEVWEVKGGVVFEFTNPALIFDRMNDIEAEIEQIKMGKYLND